MHEWLQDELEQQGEERRHRWSVRHVQSQLSDDFLKQIAQILKRTPKCKKRDDNKANQKKKALHDHEKQKIKECV